MMDKLIECAEQDPIHRDALLHKVNLYKTKLELIRNPEQFQKLIDAVDGMLIDIELQLERQFRKCFYIGRCDWLMRTNGKPPYW